MRRIFLLLLLTGSLLGIGYPWYVSNFTGEKLTKLVLFERGKSWKPVQVELDELLFPVGVKVRLVVDAPSEKLSETGRFSLKVRGPRGLSYREILEFSLKPVGDGAVDGTTQELWQFADNLQFIASKPYVFALETLGKNPLSIKSAELHLTANIGEYDAKLLPVATVLMGVGGFGFVLLMLRGWRRKRAGNKPRWGRKDK